MTRENAIYKTDKMDLSADRLPTKHASLRNLVNGVPLLLALSSE